MARKKGSKATPDKPLSPAAMRARMERILREVGKLDLGEMTAEQADAYLQEQLASGRFDKIEPETPLEQAQELVYEAWDATGKRRVDLARLALEISPDCADAYLVLAEAAALLNRFKDDPSSGWAYNCALLAFRKSGESHRADRALNRALEANVFVPLYILGLAPPPIEAPDLVGIGDGAEAIDYAMTAHRSWAHLPEAANWLARA